MLRKDEHIVIRFPFLIGRIRTKTPKELFFPDTRFPFLIGRIRTFLLCALSLFYFLFPFLIGRIRTLPTLLV